MGETQQSTEWYPAVTIAVSQQLRWHLGCFWGRGPQRSGCRLLTVMPVHGQFSQVRVALTPLHLLSTLVTTVERVVSSP
jgi:hypothetical protein